MQRVTDGSFGYTYQGGASDRLSYLQLPGYQERGYPYVYHIQDGLARLTDTALYGQSPVLNQHIYSYDAGNQRTQQVFTAGNYVNYTYDKIGQLKTAKGLKGVAH